MLLIRVMVLALFLVGALFSWRWWKASRMVASGGLSTIEVSRMMKIAGKSKRMEAALLMRTRILGEAERSNMQALSERVDPVLRKLARQVELRQDIATILSELDEDSLERQVRTAGAELTAARDEADRIIAETKKQQLETQLEHLRALRERRRELEEAGDRIIRELQNLHLALVNASATEAKAQLTSGDVQSSLAQLEEASEALKHRAQAEDEVSQLLDRARRGAEGQSRSATLEKLKD